MFVNFKHRSIDPNGQDRIIFLQFYETRLKDPKEQKKCLAKLETKFSDSINHFLFRNYGLLWQNKPTQTFPRFSASKGRSRSYLLPIAEGKFVLFVSRNKASPYSI